ncbi:hypothetical protein FQN54_003149 [Arachnomyces sp. PD_36]|nr:hypothetical protein FQN54_003149 [Arachnomyces sp. PD_36]
MATALRIQTRDEIQKLPKRRLFGNTEGLKTMDKIDRLEREVQLLKEAAGLHRLMELDCSAIRLEILEGKDDEDAAPYDSVSVRITGTERNENWHGGNILADFSVLKQLRRDGNPKLEQCCQKFLEIYGIKFQSAQNIIYKAPDSIIALYDFRGHIRLLKKWKNATGQVEELAREIETECGSAISLWEKWAGGSGEGNEPSFDGKKREVRQLYAQFDA